jgi:hypothetical protein
MVMSDAFRDWLESDQVLRQEAPATEAQLQELESQIGQRLAEPLRQCLLLSGSPEGFFGESYIAFFSTREIATCWRQSQEAAAGFIPFASNGGGEWYGYDSRSTHRPFVLLPSIGMEWQAAMLLANTWDAFLDALNRGDLFEQNYAAS